MLTKNAIGNLKNRYIAVLKKCNLLNIFGSLAVVGAITASLGLANMLLPENAHALSQYLGEDYAIIDTAKNPELKDENFLTTFEVDGKTFGLLVRNPYDNNYLIGSVDSLIASYEGYLGGAGTWEMATQGSSTSSSTGTGSSLTYGDFYDFSGGSFLAGSTPATGSLVNTVTTSGSERITDPSGDITGPFVGLSIDGIGGAILSDNEVNSITASFIDNSADNGGAIFNSDTIHTLNGIFIGNSADSGGAIDNAHVINMLNGIFIGNNANGSGGAIASGAIGTLNGLFIGNSASSNGGAIAGGAIGTLNGLFIGNSAHGIGENAGGGAIYLSNIDTLYASFIGNSAVNALGGAIRSNVNINLITGNGLNLFAGNTDSTGSNAIYNAGTFDINTGFDPSAPQNGMGYVHIKDNISGNLDSSNSPYGTFTINGTLQDSQGNTRTGVPTNGFVMMDGVMADNNLVLQGGSLFFTDGTIKEHFNGGDFSTATGSVLYLDVDDEITASGGKLEGTLAYNILDENQTHFSPIIDSDIDTTAITFARAYTQDAEYEYVGNNFAIGGSDGLSSAIANSNVGTGRVSTYSITSSSDYVVPINQNLTKGTLTIFGNQSVNGNYKLDASDVENMVNVGTDATLNILNAEIVFTGYNQANGTAIINSGTTNIFNSEITYSKNYAIDAQSGVVNIYNSTLSSNETAAINIESGAIVNVYASYGDTVFRDNFIGTNPKTAFIVAQNATVNLRAQGGSIILGDSISGDGAVNINDIYHSGTIAINADMSGYRGDVTFNNGTITVDGNLSPQNTTDYTPFFNNFNVHGGTLDSINEKIDKFNMQNWDTTNAVLNARIDVDLRTETADFFDNSTNQSVNITAIDLIDTYTSVDQSTGNTESVKIDFSEIDDVSVQVANATNNFTLATLRAYSPTYMYDVSSANLQSQGTISFGNARANPMTEAPNVTANITANVTFDNINNALDNMMNSSVTLNPPLQYDSESQGESLSGMLVSTDPILREGGDLTPFIEGGYTYVPLRFTSEATGDLSVTSDNIGLITGVLLNTESSATATSSNSLTIESPAIMSDDRYFLPFRVLGELVLGVPVSWDEASRTATFNDMPEILDVTTHKIMEEFYSGYSGGSAPAILEQALYANSMQNQWTAWAEPYANFESTETGAYAIDTESYGLVAGINSRRFDLGVFDMAYSAYIGYNGAQSDYSTVETEQNGGTIGLGATLFYGNFTLGATVNAALTSNEITNNDVANTFYTSDEYNSTTLGFGVSGAYTFSFQEGKYNLRPSLGISYSHVNTEDYTNSAGLITAPEATGTWNIAPALTFVANLDNNWTLHATAKYNFLIKDDSVTYVGGLPIASGDVDNYATFAVGVSKAWENVRFYTEVSGNLGGRESVGVNMGLEVKF